MTNSTLPTKDSTFELSRQGKTKPETFTDAFPPKTMDVVTEQETDCNLNAIASD